MRTALLRADGGGAFASRILPASRQPLVTAQIGVHTVRVPPFGGDAGQQAHTGPRR